MPLRHCLPLALAGLALSGCAASAIQHKDGRTTARPYTLTNLVKSDVDMVSEIMQAEAIEILRRLSLKLYRRNPQEFRKAGLTSAEEASARIFADLAHWSPQTPPAGRWEERFRAAFDEAYDGDRVYAFMRGLTVMILASYDYRREFFLTDKLDAQKLYNSARNVETAVWKLSQARRGNGELFLLSNSLEGEPRNLSFEREFGKLIATQDLIALIIEDKSNRAITRVLHRAASFVFLPI